MSDDVDLCWNWQHAPHGCAQVSRQVVRDATGAVVEVYRCTFCAREKAQSENLVDMREK